MLIAFCFSPAIHAQSHILCSNADEKCMENLQNYPLFDTDYKIAANYVPILAPRALAHAEIYREKKSAKLTREYFVKNLEGVFGEPYQITSLDIETKNHGLFGRKIIAKGKINDFDLEYENKISAHITKTASMKIKAKLGDIEILDLKVKSDGNKKTNEVEGVFFAKPVKYFTQHRDSNGTLANLDYELHTEGLHKEIDNFKVITRGSISDYEIFGHGTMIKPNYYEFEEHYGPILVKSKLWIKPSS